MKWIVEPQLEENKIVALEINSPHYIMLCFLAPAKKNYLYGLLPRFTTSKNTTVKFRYYQHNFNKTSG